MCREELKKLHTIYPDYIGKVTFFSVGIDPTETLIDLNSQREQGGYAWDISVAGVGMLSSLNVVQQSTKIAFNENGLIIYRKGYGEGSISEWEEVMNKLSATISNSIKYN